MFTFGIANGKSIEEDSSQGMSLVKIFAANEMSSPYFFRSGPNCEPYIVSDGICIGLTEAPSSAIVFPLEFPLKDIYWDKTGNYLYSDNTNIYLFDSNENSSTMLLNSNVANLNFRIGDTAIFYYQTNDSSLYICNYEDLTSSLLYKFDCKICDLRVIGNICIAACDNQISLLSGNENKLILEDTDIINAVEIVEGILFYGTDNGLFCFDGIDSYKITEGDVVNLSYIGEDLYIVYNDNSALKIDDIKDRCRMFYPIVNELRLKDGKTLVEVGEMDISSNQLCVFPNNGIFLLTGNELISLEENEKTPIVRIPKLIAPEDIVFTESNVYAKNDTTIVSCTPELKPIHAFDTNQFQILPTTDNNLFILSKLDSISMVFSCDVAIKNVMPFVKLSDDILFVAGDTTQCILVTPNHIYSVQEKKAWPMLDYFEPIVTATLTKSGLIFATENNILMLNGVNNVSLIAERGCRRLLSDVNTLYIYYDDGSLLSYDLNILGNKED